MQQASLRLRRELAHRHSRKLALVALAAGAFVAAPRADAGLLDGIKKLLSKVPIADVNHKYILNPPKVSDPKIGKSHSFPIALKIVVAKDSTGFPGGIGKIVHEALFSSYPRFTFKVAFACADVSLLGHSDYANPKSIWYNVFFGYYEIEVPKNEWKRP